MPAFWLFIKHQTTAFYLVRVKFLAEELLGLEHLDFRGIGIHFGEFSRSSNYFELRKLVRLYHLSKTGHT